MKSTSRFPFRTKALVAALALAISIPATGQLIYGNTFPFWNVNGPLTVVGNTSLTGGTNTLGGTTAITGTTTIGAGATLTSPTITGATLTTAALTSPDITTSITTSSTSFTAFAGATTLTTWGGTGASASNFFPSTLDATSSITGAVRTSGGISAAKAGNIGTILTVGTQVTAPIVTTSGYFQTAAPRTITSDGAIAATDAWVIANKAGTLTLTLPDPTTAGNTGRQLCVKTSQAQTVVSATSNVVPLITGAAATAILAATAGKWACMVSDATNWVIMSAN